MLPDLTWQIQVLCVETVASVLIGIMLISARVKIGQRLHIGALVWNVPLFALILTGGSGTWQHWIYFGYVLLDTILALSHLITGKRHEHKAEKKTPVFFATVMTMFLLYLLIGGSS